MDAVTGETFLLEAEGAAAEVGALAAVLREARVGGTRITETVPRDALPPGGCGIVLAPWPNRVRDGRWELDGVPQQLDLTDPGHGAASHGLLRNTAYRAVERTAGSVTLAATVFPQHGWPFLLETRVRYEVVADGLVVTHEVVNAGSGRAVWAVGAHPYLRVGETPLDDCVVTVAGAETLDLDERLLPVGSRLVAGDDDLRTGRRVAEVAVDRAYGDLANAEARADVARLEAPDGARTTLWADPAFRWVQAFALRSFPGADGPRTAVALEPMTAPPDALNSGRDLVWLEPGESWRAIWGLRHDPAPSA